MTNPNWTRWVFATLAKYTKEIASDLSLPVVVLGLDEPDANFEKAPDRVEIRITGLTTREPTAGYAQLTVDVTAVIHSMIGDTKNRYAVMRLEGAFAEALDMNIAVYKYGNGVDDNSTAWIGCLVPRTGKNDGVRVLQFGQLNPSIRATQSVVAVRYDMELEATDE